MQRSLQQTDTTMGSNAGAGTAGSEVAVDVLMLAYNVAPFIEAAVAGVVDQVVDFPIRLVIAEDHSTDETPAICQRLAAAHPGIVHYVPGERNLGLAGRNAAGHALCHAKYLALCDGDDIWTDPHKLADQLAFLEANPDHGMSYSDVDIITRSGELVQNDGYDSVRNEYAQGEVFEKLLHGNFVNNSTVLVRRELLNGFEVDTDRSNHMTDMLMWLHVSMRAKVHFLPRRTTSYRQGGVSTGSAVPLKNKRMYQTKLGALLVKYGDLGNVPREVRPTVFRKMLGVLWRSGTDLRTKRALLSHFRTFMPLSPMGWRRAFFKGDTLRHNLAHLKRSAS